MKVRFWSWISERLFDASEWCSNRAIGRRALKSYRRAIVEPSAPNVEIAIKDLQACAFRLRLESGAGYTVSRCLGQMERFADQVVESDED